MIDVNNMHIDRTDSLLKDFLTDSGVVSKTEMKLALNDARERKIPLSQALVLSGAVGEDDVRRAYSALTGIPFVSLANRALSYEILSLVPEPISRIKRIVSFARKGEGVEVASLEPLDADAVSFLEERIGAPVLCRLTDAASMKYALIAYQRGVRTHVGGQMDSHSETLLSELSKNPALSGEYIKVLAESSQASELLESVIWYANSQHADHIHLEPADKGLSVKFRIGGSLHEGMVLPARIAPIVSARLKMLSGLTVEETALAQEGKVSFGEGASLRTARISVVPTHRGERIVLRLFKETSAGFTLETLGFHGKGLEDTHKALHARSGLILVAGPASSGKTTLLYTMIDIANRPGKTAISVEEHIEHSLAGVNQITVRPDKGLSFPAAVRAAMRQDADILMISEIKDHDTAMLAVSAAAHGRLVLASVKTENISGLISKMEDFGISPAKLASVLSLAVTSRLSARTSYGDKEIEIPEKELMKRIKGADLKLVITALQEEGVLSPKGGMKMPVFMSAGEGLSDKRDKRGVYEVVPVGLTSKTLVAASDVEALKAEMRLEKSLLLEDEALFAAFQKHIPLEEAFRIAGS